MATARFNIAGSRVLKVARAVRFVRASVEIDANRELVLRYGVTSAPTLVLLREGEVVWRTVGARGAGRLGDELASFL